MDWFYYFVEDIRQLIILPLLTEQLVAQTTKRIQEKIQTEVQKTIDFIASKSQKLKAISAAIGG